MDKAEFMTKAGNGGDGSASFRREKFVPFGGPDGGDGGDGGNIYVVAGRSIANLREFRSKRKIVASSGGNGGRQKMHGVNGDDNIILVPLGTMVFYEEDGRKVLLADLDEESQKVMVAKGGRGGLGNVHFATATNQAPKEFTRGEPGEERHLILDLKLIADVGIFGYPNAGKSTLLASVSRAKPKTADYPFTTREPVLGLVEVGVKEKPVVLAEIPGLIDGAHLGKGLGYDFLRHVERTKALIHLLDGSSMTIAENMNNLNTELTLYNPLLMQKPQIVAVNKIDLPQVQDRLSEIKQLFDSLGITVFFISAVTKQGVPELISAVTEMVNKIGKGSPVVETPPVVFRPEPEDKRG